MERFTKNSVDLETSIFSILENYFSSLLAICNMPTVGNRILGKFNVKGTNVVGRILILILLWYQQIDCRS